jgi:hypothetical protein
MSLDIFNNSFKAAHHQPDLLEAWEAHYCWRTTPHFSSEIVSLLAKGSVPAVEPGQLWDLNQKLNGPNDDGLHLNLPTVLILFVSDYRLTVIPTAPFVELMGHSDIYLNDDEGFVEPWNRFTLPLEALEGYRGSISIGLLERIRAANTAWPSSTGFDWEEAFFNLESDLTKTAVQRAAVWKFLPTSWQDRLETFWSSLKELAWELKPSMIGHEILTAASKESVGVIYRTQSGTTLGTATITGILEENGQLNIKGTLISSRALSMDALFAWIETKSDQVKTPETVFFKAPYFELEFTSVETYDRIRLQLLVLSYDS